MTRFELYALGEVLSEFPEGMSYDDILDYLRDEYDGDLDSEIIVLEEFEYELGFQLADRVEEAHKTVVWWFDDPDSISITWTVEDVIDQASMLDLELTKEEAREILASVKKNHNAEVGVNWDVIADAISVYKDSYRIGEMHLS